MFLKSYLSFYLQDSFENTTRTVNLLLRFSFFSPPIVSMINILIFAYSEGNHVQYPLSTMAY